MNLCQSSLTFHTRNTSKMKAICTSTILLFLFGLTFGRPENSTDDPDAGKFVPVVNGTKPVVAFDRSVYARTADAVKDVTSDIYRVIVGPVEVQQQKSAVVVLNVNSDKSGVSGVLLLTQARNDAPVHISGNVTGLSPGKHGFHVHETGDIRDGCKSTKGHYNPFKQPHGAPDSKNRHTGDLGNIVAGENGNAQVDIMDAMMTLYGPNTIAGRAIVVHEGEDDLGQGGDEGSMTTGNAGGRLVCGIIGTTM